VLQQVTQGRCAGLMQGGTLMALGEDAAEQRAYFARDLGVDRRGRFFTSGVSVPSTGRD